MLSQHDVSQALQTFRSVAPYDEDVGMLLKIVDKQPDYWYGNYFNHLESIHDLDVRWHRALLRVKEKRQEKKQIVQNNNKAVLVAPNVQITQTSSNNKPTIPSTSSNNVQLPPKQNTSSLSAKTLPAHMLMTQKANFGLVLFVVSSWFGLATTQSMAFLLQKSSTTVWNFVLRKK